MILARAGIVRDGFNAMRWGRPAMPRTVELGE
jgi:hypothetical protein